jgi:hypothetical protein
MSNSTIPTLAELTTKEREQAMVLYQVTATLLNLSCRFERVSVLPSSSFGRTYRIERFEASVRGIDHG